MTSLEGTTVVGVVAAEVATDDELVEELRRGDSAALGQLFDRYADRIYNYCFRRVGSWHQAEDLTSVTFLEAWKARERAAAYDGQALPWLYGVATNVCRNATRSQRRLLRAVDRLPAEHAQDHADDVAEAVDDERRMAEVLGALDQLSERDRDVVVLIAWSGLTYEQAAHALHVPVGTVRSRLARARQRLSHALNGADHD
jgi:RNA polymerase sigma factor (sigma-70 family)